jgi:hypothetical protein
MIDTVKTEMATGFSPAWRLLSPGIGLTFSWQASSRNSLKNETKSIYLMNDEGQEQHV